MPRSKTHAAIALPGSTFGLLWSRLRKVGEANFSEEVSIMLACRSNRPLPKAATAYVELFRYVKSILDALKGVGGTHLTIETNSMYVKSIAERRSESR